MSPNPLHRIRWANVARAAAVLAAVALIVAWPQLKSPPPELPDADVAVVEPPPPPSAPEEGAVGGAARPDGEAEGPARPDGEAEGAARPDGEAEGAAARAAADRQRSSARGRELGPRGRPARRPKRTRSKRRREGRPPARSPRSSESAPPARSPVVRAAPVASEPSPGAREFLPTPP